MDDNLKKTSDMLTTLSNHIAKLSEVSVQRDLVSAIASAQKRLSMVASNIDSESKEESIFRRFHLLERARKGLSDAYRAAESIDYDQFSSGLTKTKAAQLTSAWRAISKTYAVYIRDYKIDASGPASALDGVSPSRMSELFHKYPFSIELYVEAMNRRLAVDGTAAATIATIVENDKSYALAEKKWRSPYTMCGVSSGGPPAETLQKLLGVEGKLSLDETASVTTKRTGGPLTVIWRQCITDKHIQLQDGIDSQKGMSSSDIRPLFTDIAGDEWKWTIRTWDPADAKAGADAGAGAGAHTVVEIAGDGTARLLDGPGKPKIAARQFGRPENYYKMRDAFQPDSRVQKIGSRQPTGVEHKFNHTIIVSAMTEAFEKTTGTLVERINDPLVWKAFQESMLSEAPHPELSTLLYMINGLERTFRQDFHRAVASAMQSSPAPPSKTGAGEESATDGGAATGDKKSATPAPPISCGGAGPVWFGDMCRELLRSLLQRHDSVFGFLNLKSSIVTDLRSHRGLKED